MLFNSFAFLIFFPLVVCAYFAAPQRFRWILLLAASWYFYGSWNPRYLSLLILTTLIDYAIGLAIGSAATTGRKKTLLAVSLVSNLGLLFVFKYFNFAASALSGVFGAFNLFVHAPELGLLLPVGISFYTFQSLSYTIDVYRGVQKPERHFGLFAVYVSFFPQLVAGPIERSTNLLPQFQSPKRHRLEWARVQEGLQLMMWGFVKKVVLADRLASYVEPVYGNVAAQHGAELLLATYFFAIQIYCDFSGYSDIAVGSARIMGYDLMTNFRTPYIAGSIREFWQRWHISLSTWFRDYVYVPLGGNRGTAIFRLRNVLLTFLLSGIWHGANWTFVIWGLLHGTYVVVGTVTEPLRKTMRTLTGLEASPALRSVWQTFVTFHLVALGWIFFRAANVTDAFQVIEKIGAFLLNVPAAPLASIFSSGLWRPRDVAFLFALIAAAGAYEHVQSLWKRRAPVAMMSVQFWLIAVYGMFNNKEFIYFQF